MPAPVLVLNRWTRNLKVIVPDVILMCILSYARLWSVIISNSSKCIKAGFCPGDVDQATVSIEPIIKYLKDNSNNTKIYNYKDNNYCIKQNIIIDFDNIKSIWNYIFEYKLFYPSNETKVLMTESPMAPKNKREQKTKIMFEHFDIDKFYLLSDAVLAVYSTGKTSGVSVNIGYDCFEMVGVFDGYYIPSSFVRTYVGENQCKLYLKNQIEFKNKIKLSKNDLNTIINDICFVNNFKKIYKQKQKNQYILPDGKKIIIENEEKYKLFEQYFKPFLFLRDDTEGITNQFCNKCYQNISNVAVNKNMIIFGNAFDNNGHNGFNKRLYSEFCYRLGLEIQYNFNQVLVNDPGNAVWKGAHILCSLESFDERFITKDDYEECGTNIIHRKCENCTLYL